MQGNGESSVNDIYYVSREIDENGHEIYWINGSEGYDLTSGWTVEEAEKHYNSEEGRNERWISTMAAFGAYD